MSTLRGAIFFRYAERKSSKTCTLRSWAPSCQYRLGENDMDGGSQLDDVHSWRALASPSSRRRGTKIWLDVGDLLSWRHDHVTGIQRVMVCVAAEFLKLHARGEPIGFCRHAEEMGFIEVLADRLRPRILRLRGEKISALPPRRVGNLLRTIYSQLSRTLEPVPGEGHTLLKTWVKAPLRRIEVWLVRRWLRSNAIFKDRDVVLNVGSSWEQPVHRAALAKIRLSTDLHYVVLIHDLIPWRLPQFFTPALVSRFVTWARETVGDADRLLVTSASSRNDLIAFTKEFEIGDRTITMVRLGQEEITRLATPLPVELRQISAGFVLCVGTVEPRKNHKLLLRAWSRLLQRYDRSLVPTLVWAGREGWMCEELLDEVQASNFLDGKLVWVGRAGGVTENALHGLYRACLFTVFPSIYEGWGLPVAEGLAYGKFCVASNASSIPEIGGDLIDYHGPNDLEACFALVERAIFDPKYRATREAIIRREYRMPSWVDCCQDIFEICRSSFRAAQDRGRADSFQGRASRVSRSAL